MHSPMRNVITAVNVLPSGRLAIEFRDGAAGEIDVRAMCGGDGVFARFADREFFEQVRVGEGGRYLEWPGDIDLCADALRRQLIAHASHGG